jgi:hypothetical protein
MLILLYIFNHQKWFYECKDPPYRVSITLWLVITHISSTELSKDTVVGGELHTTFRWFVGNKRLRSVLCLGVWATTQILHSTRLEMAGLRHQRPESIRQQIFIGHVLYSRYDLYTRREMVNKLDSTPFPPFQAYILWAWCSPTKSPIGPHF